MQVKPNRTYASLDLWRGIAALWVVLFHGVTSITHSTMQAIHGDWFASFCEWGDAGVHLFFVISGFCITAAGMTVIEKGTGWYAFMKARVRRIFPTYWVSLGIVLLLMVLATYVQRIGIIGDSNLATVYNRITPFSFVANFLLIQMPTHQQNISIVAWTLSYELAFYSIVGLMIVLAIKRGGMMMLKMLHFITLVSAALSVLAPQLLFFPFDKWICFGMGALLFDLLCGHPWKQRSVRNKCFCVAATGVLAVLVAVPLFNNSGNYGAWHVAIGAAFAVLLFLLHPFDGRIVRIKVLKGMFLVGSISYSLYLTHFALIGIVCQVASRVFRVSVAYYRLELCVMVIVTLAGASLFYRLVESRFLSKRTPSKNEMAQPPVQVVVL